MLLHDAPHYRQGTGQHLDARFATAWRDGKRVLLPGIIFFGEVPLDLITCQPLPAAVVDLAQVRLLAELQTMGRMSMITSMEPFRDRFIGATLGSV